MDTLGVGEITGIAGVAAGFGVLLWRMWQSHTELSKMVIGVVEKDAQSKAELKAVIKNNNQVTKETRDVLSNVLLELVKKQNIDVTRSNNN